MHSEVYPQVAMHKRPLGASLSASTKCTEVVYVTLPGVGESGKHETSLHAGQKKLRGLPHDTSQRVGV